MPRWIVRTLFGLVAFIFATLGALLAVHLMRPDDSEQAARALQALSLPDVGGTPRALAQWRGKPMVINFWATWCPPCREEMPLLAAAAQRKPGSDMQFVGIALDETEAVGKFAQTSPMPYPLLVGGMAQGSLMAKLGNASQLLPFTVFVNADGSVAHTKLGELKAQELDKLLASLAAGNSQQK